MNKKAKIAGTYLAVVLFAYLLGYVNGLTKQTKPWNGPDTQMGCKHVTEADINKLLGE